jgi:hypothetical protein
MKGAYVVFDKSSKRGYPAGEKSNRNNRKGHKQLEPPAVYGAISTRALRLRE